MYKFYYFVKRTVGRDAYNNVLNKFQCIRLPAGDARIPEFEEKYKPLGWNMFVTYSYKPKEEDEIFQLKQRFQAYNWSDVFEIEDLSEPKKSQLA
jgi:hypothetical protein